MGIFDTLRIPEEHEPAPVRLAQPWSRLREAEAAEQFDPRFMPHPARMSRHVLIQQIIRYAARHGVFTGYTEDQAAARAEKLPDDQLRQWAGQVVRAFPWPFNFAVPSFSNFVHGESYLRSDFTLSGSQVHLIEGSLGPSAWEWFVRPRRVSKVVACLGKGSGKDLVASCVAAYTAGMVDYMRNPWFHFGMPTGEVLDFINVAESEDQARDIYFEKLKRNLETPFFKPLLDQDKHIHADDVEFWRPVPGEAYPRLCLRIQSSHSRASGTEGRNTFFAVLDEVDAMRTKANGPKNARDIYNSLRTSSRFGPWQIMLLLSWPRDQDGFIFEMLKQAGNLNPNGAPEIWGMKAATWEVLPEKKAYIPGRWQGEHFHEITHEKFEIDDPTVVWTNHARSVFLPSNERDGEMAQTYRDDIEVFNATFACEPPAAEGAYFSMPAKLAECEAEWLVPIADLTPSTTTDVTTLDGRETTYRYVAWLLDAIRLRPNCTYFIGADPGRSNDSFALSMMHAVPREERGSICTGCWNTWEKRFAKHYVPFQLPEKDSPEARKLSLSGYSCDHCGRLPELGVDLYWGRCEASGRMVQRPKPLLDEHGKARYTASGEALFQTKPGTDIPVMEEVWQPVVVEDLLIVWKPDRGTGKTVDFRNVRDCILKLVRAARTVGSQVGGAMFDDWQAELMIQEIREAGTPCTNKQFSNPEQLKMYGNLKTLVYGNSVWFLHSKYVGQLPMDELKRVQLVNLNKIDHPQGGSKDVSDARCLAGLQCVTMAGLLGSIDFGMDEKTASIYAGMDEQAMRDWKAEQGMTELGIVEQALGDPRGNLPMEEGMPLFRGGIY
jgi:hypothetical protein